MTSHRPKPLVLCILDGWGHRTEAPSNAVMAAKTPFLDAVTPNAPMSLLQASELYVGLPEGQMGNSEVGHMNIGSGRVVMQELPRIDNAIADGSLATHPGLQALIGKLKANGKTCHILGLLSPGGVHAHQKHIAALGRILADSGVKVRIHAFLDGRDTPPSSALEYLADFRRDIAGLKDVSIATVSGRYYAMDRDKRWERVQKAYDVLATASGPRFAAPEEAVNASYAQNVTDEFVIPCAIGDYAGMEDGDGLIMANFRSDRAREILQALLVPGFKEFPLKNPKFSAAIGMVEYSAELSPHLTALYPPQKMDRHFGQVISESGMKQLRIAETEKYAHVTFFFSCGREEPFPGEERILVPSPKVATYDLQPEMSAPQVTEKMVEAISSGNFDVVIANYANPDMVGHTGDIPAAIKAVETIDACLKRVWEAVKLQGGAMILTADHGNIEMMVDASTHQPHTAHTTNPVPFMLLSDAMTKTNTVLKNGSLCDIAPTMLDLLGLPKPVEMTGHSLLVRK
ncbi:MAG: 2,3-bisphosphoglycerate-independent phosphoglycerate mutase [Alphaproteobacteria bacterium]|nr:2,3-bisphosphoglycerate-independent phosphoglycerate mutase [Alphaproteobacteria bacterium]